MKTFTLTFPAVLGALLSASSAGAVHGPKAAARDVDTTYPYTGPDIPIGDWVDQTVNGNGRGFPRLHEPPAVKPRHSKPSNNVNVISVAYVPGGVNVHYSTPFGLGQAPAVHWGTRKHDLCYQVSGLTKTYDRTPPCSEVALTQCNQYFHDVQITGLKPGQTYFYKIPAANGTTESSVLSFTTAREAGADGEFSVAVLNDMGYTNAHGTHKQLVKAAEGGVAFAWHGGDISYADDWYSGILPCEDDWPVCYNGSSTRLPGEAPIPAEYFQPLPKGEIPDQGGPQGGDMSVLYESNWDLWQQWMNAVTLKIPYMVLPGNHEAACSEFDGGKNIMTAYLNNNETNSTAPESELNYYSCPPSQRNFTTFQHRFRMPGAETAGRSNFWYSFDYGLAHFVSIDTETDFPYSPEWPFVRDIPANSSETHPLENQTYVTDSGPFGAINGNWTENESYEQYHWLRNDLASVDRSKTPWVVVMGHRPMYSSQVSSYQKNLRDAFEDLMLDHGVDAYFAGHIHWYERMFPIGKEVIDTAAIVNNATYRTNEGRSMLHVVNGQAGNIESHSTLGGDAVQNYTAVLDGTHYGFSKLTVHNATALTWQFIHGEGGVVGDEVVLLKGDKDAAACQGN